MTDHPKSPPRKPGDKEPARSPASRNVAIAGAVAVAAFGIYWLTRPQPHVVPEPTKSESVATLPPPSIVGPLPPRLAVSAADDASVPNEPPPQGGPPPADREGYNKRKAEMTRRALQDIKHQLSYPLWSAPLTENMQYTTPYSSHVEAKGPGGAFPTLEVFPEKPYYGNNEKVRVIAIAHGEHGIIDFDALTGKTKGAPSRPRPVMELQWTQRPDKTYVAELDIAPEVARKERGEWSVEIDCQIAGEHRVSHTEFYEMITDATITGPNRAALENGSLSVYVTINATAASRQHLAGELWGPKDEPIAYAWVRNDTTAVGTSTMKLVFYGKAIRDSGIDGPYHVRNLVLSTFPENNDQIANPVVDPGPDTPALLHTAFTDAAINADNAILKEKKAILEGELKKAEGNGFDPNQPNNTPATKADKHGPPPQ